MKTVKLKEESLRKILGEAIYGNDDLESLFENLRIEFSDFYSVLGEHYIMLNRLKQEATPEIVELKEHADAINAILEQHNGI